MERFIKKPVPKQAEEPALMLHDYVYARARTCVHGELKKKKRPDSFSSVLDLSFQGLSMSMSMG